MSAPSPEEWVIDGRYPEDTDDVSPGEVRRIFETAERVVDAVRQAFPAEVTGEDAREEE